MQRRVPRPADFSQVLRFKRPELSATRRRLAAAHTIHDLRDIAQRVTPRAPFDYTDGAAEGEISLARARQAFEDVELHPAILRDVSAVDTSCTVLGGPSALSFGIAPTGFTRIMHTEGEQAGAAAAGAAGIPFSLSTVGTATPEQVRAANPDGRYIGFDPNGAADGGGPDGAADGGGPDGAAVELRAELFEATRHLADLRPDLIISRHVLEHLVNPLGFLQRIGFAAAAESKKCPKGFYYDEETGKCVARRGSG